MGKAKSRFNVLILRLHFNLSMVMTVPEDPSLVMEKFQTDFVQIDN